MTHEQQPDASRVEAAEAGVHHEAAQAVPVEHVTATDAVPAHPHHPVDPNETLLRGPRTPVRAAAAGLGVAAVTLGALGGVAYAIARGAS